MTKGKICIFEDEWVFRDEHARGEPRGWLSNATNHKRFVTNMMGWFTGGKASKVLAYSSLYKGSNAVNVTKTVQELGHTWITEKVPCTLESLNQYDVVFFSTLDRDVIESVLVDYVNGGGNVFVAAGQGDKDASVLEVRFDDFLEVFGLGFSKTYDDSKNDTYAPVVDPENHPVTEGLTSINIFRGMPCLDVDPTISGHKILCDGIFGVFDGAASGKVIVLQDERGLMDARVEGGNGWELNEANHERYVSNVCNWFTGGKPGKILGASSLYTKMHTKLEAAVEKAGHSWTTGIPDITLEILQQYDGVFMTSNVAEFEASVIIEYVKTGGNLYLATGTGDPLETEPNVREICAAFGFATASEYAVEKGGNIPVDSSCHVIFEGVESLCMSRNTPVSDINPATPGHCVLMDGMVGIFTG